MKKKNAKRIKNFGLKQVSVILMVLGALALVVSLFLTDLVEADTILIASACGVLVVAFGLSLVNPVFTVVDKAVNRRSPAFKNALLSAVIGIVMLALATAGFILAITELIG